MKLIIGLGNPGSDYTLTRHNFGHLVLDQLCQKNNLHWQTKKTLLADIAEYKVAGEKIILAKTLTFMNESGQTLAHLKKFFKLKNSDIIVAHDDLDFDFGQIKISFDRSAGGHNGLKSIIQHLKSATGNGQDFIRLRLGIGPQLGVAENFVLLKFNVQQKKQLPKILDLSCLALEEIVSDGLAIACNKYNSK